MKQTGFLTATHENRDNPKHVLLWVLNNIYVVLFIKGRIVLSVWPIYTLFVFRLTQCIHNKQIIQNCSLLFVFDLNYFNMVSELVLWNEV
jgi:hypothetical protein